MIPRCSRVSVTECLTDDLQNKEVGGESETKTDMTSYMQLPSARVEVFVISFVISQARLLYRPPTKALEKSSE